ncbi:MAG: UvrD-helicase domain-containing protein [Chloroflexi bacterium]|nr:UvrD-helicase domain-containing protein [Chloroflexota bacterium]
MKNTSWFDELNSQQKIAVSYEAAPLLVLAGPGSGKTRILTHRIYWLIHSQKVPPEQILAVTFTNRAAEEMRERLYAMLSEDAGQVWIYTFHATAVRILRRFGDKIGLDPHFSILDDEDQRRLLARLLWRAGLSRETYPVGWLAHEISEWKTQLVLGRESAEDGDPAIIEIRRLYETWLQEHQILDFDDLIRYAVLLLRRNDDVRNHFHGTLKHVLVDEYQDINIAQYELLKLLAPLAGSITAVADDDQSIYGWRGSRPELIDDFVDRYRPHIINLDLSYRCPPKILYGAQHLIAQQQSREQRRFLHSTQEDDIPIFHYIFDDISQEQRWILALIQKLIDERGYKPGDIGILYRTHRLATPIEQVLIQAGFKVHRLKKESFFDQSEVRDIVRYLQLVRSLQEDYFSAALNFPRHIVDVLTMIQLRRIADTLGISLIELARQCNEFPELSPLTRHHLRRFMAVLTEALPKPEQDADSAMKALFDLFDQLRSPWRKADIEVLEGFMSFTDHLTEQAHQIAGAIEQQLPLFILHPTTLDGYAAAAILQNTLQDYLQVTIPSAPLADFVADNLPTTTRYIALGNEAVERVAAWSEQCIAITAPDNQPTPYSLSIYAWRCAQLLLMSFETLAQGRFVVYDTETTGINVRRDELVEIAAATYEDQQIVGEPYHQFIRPECGYIPRAATKVHGIQYKDVAQAPTIIQALPDFLEYIGRDTLVGHNISRFDNRFIDRAMGRLYEGKGFTPYYVDTLRLARRFLPNLGRYTLETLIRELGIGKRVEHRASSDIEHTAALFFELSERLLDEKEREALGEYLPWVALGMLDAGIEIQDEKQALLHGAVRVLTSSPSVDTWLSPFPVELHPQAQSLLQKLHEYELPQTEEDQSWHDLRDTFLTHVQSFQSYSQDTSITAFLDYVALLHSIDTFAHVHDPEAISMMTLHNAKGSEFPVVMIIGLEEENLPLWRTLDDPEQLAEERRVLYVGITRAKKAVYLFSTRDRHDRFKRRPSSFAFDIPSEYIRRFRIDARGGSKEL